MRVMTQLADIVARIDNVRQLDAVVTAMRGIAASRVQQSRALLPGIAAYATSISHAISQALTLIPDPAPEAGQRTGEKREALILFCAEHGFAGGFSHPILDAAMPADPGRMVAIVGSRGEALAPERGLKAAWTAPMASQTGAVAALANRIADALYARIVTGDVSRARVVHAGLDTEGRIATRQFSLFPLERDGIGPRESAVPPLTTVAPEILLQRLTAEYIFARLCDAAMQSFAAENAARLAAMSAASTNIRRMRDELESRKNQVRHEEITAEIVELSAGVEARMSVPNARRRESRTKA